MKLKNIITNLSKKKFNLNFNFMYKKKILIYSHKYNEVNLEFIKKKI